MPEWPHIVISGILAGGILGFRNVLCFSHLRWPSCLCCLFRWFCFDLMAGVVHGTEDAIATNFSRRIAIPSWPVFSVGGFLLVGFCLLVFVFVCLFFLCFLVLLVVLCSAHEAWECSLDYVQVRNRLLLWPVYLDGHAWEFTNSVSASTNLLNDLAEAMKALDGNLSSLVYTHLR